MSFIGNKKTVVQEIIDGLSSNLKPRHIFGVTISPNEARALAKLVDPDCKPFTREVWERLVEDIHLGKWVLSPYPLVVSDQGLIIDGQNRLYACAMSERAIVINVEVGFPHRNKQLLIPDHLKPEKRVVITIEGIGVSG